MVGNVLELQVTSMAITQPNHSIIVGLMLMLIKTYISENIDHTYTQWRPALVGWRYES